MRTIKILGLLFLALLLILVVVRNRLLDLGIRQVLRMQGATTIAVEVRRVSLHEIRLATLAFSLPRPGKDLTVRAHDLAVTYDYHTLRAGRIRAVTIDALRIGLPRGPSPGSSPSPGLPENLSDISWQDRIPLERLTIRRLQVTGERAGPLADRTFALAMTADTAGLHATLTLAGPGGSSFRLAGDLSRRNRLALRLEEGRGTEIGHLALHPGRDRRLAGEFSLHLDRLGRLAPLLPGPLPRLGGTVSGKGFLATGRGATTFSLDIGAGKTALASIDLEHLSLHLEGSLGKDGEIVLARRARLALSGLRTPHAGVAGLDLGLAGRYAYTDAELRLAPADDRKWTATGITVSGVSCRKLELVPAFSLGLRPGRAGMVLSPDFRLQATGVDGAGFHLAGLALAPRQRTGIELQQGRWSMHPGDWELGPLNVTARDAALQLQPGTLSVDRLAGENDLWQARGELRSGGLLLAGRGRRLPLTDILLHLAADNNLVQGKIAFSAGQLPGRVETTFRHQPATGRGRADLHTTAPLRFSREHPLAALVPGLPLDLDRGKLTLTAAASWSAGKPPGLQVGVDLEEGGGRAGDILFSGLEIREKLQVLPRIRSLVPATIVLARLDAGIRVDDLEAEIGLEPPAAGRRPVLRVDRFTAHLFGGRVTTSGLVLDPDRPDGRCTIVISGMDLAEIVRLMQIKDLQVSGLVDGRLPVALTGAGITIAKGELRNRPPGGVIRYRPREKGGLADMELTGYALRAMEDFRYNLLTARVEYRPDGQLTVALHLEGHSPNLETTRPVHLNINTEQNLLSLLKSLRYSRSLTDELDKSIQRHYNTSPSPGQ